MAAKFRPRCLPIGTTNRAGDHCRAAVRSVPACRSSSLAKSEFGHRGRQRHARRRHGFPVAARSRPSGWSKRSPPTPTAASRRANSSRFPRSSTPALSLEQLVGSSPEFRAALAVAAKAARNRLPILIIGEPGTGKETVARAIHAASLRARGPMVIVDCKAVPANVVDSELFGHVKGAFPGAFAEKIGPDARSRHGLARPRRDRGASPFDAGNARPRARHRRSPPGRLQRQLVDRRPPDRDRRARRFRRASTRCSASGSASRS